MSVKFETQTIGTRVSLAEGLSFEGRIYLQRSPMHPSGLETPVELLNRSEKFFPMHLATGEVVLLPKTQVVYMTSEAPEDHEEAERQSAAKVLDLYVVMVGGAEFKGSTIVELPPTHSRVLDFLNLSESFFTIRAGSQTTCINRSHVRFVYASD